MPGGGSQHVAERRPAAAGPVLLTVLAWVVGLAATAAVVGSPSLVFGLHSRSAHLVLNTVDGCVAVLVTYLLWGRFLRRRQLQDVLLAEGLLVLAAGGLLPDALAALVDTGRPGTTEVWWAMAMRVTGALLVAASAAVGRERLLVRGLRPAVAAPLVALVAALLVLWWVRDALPVALPRNPPASAVEPVITGHPLLIAGHALTAVAFGATSVLFAVQARRRRDQLLLWLGPACAVAACARVNYVLFPSLYTDWVYTGDLLRTASYGLMLVGAAREIGDHWTGWATATVLEDRRRLARELHDGVAQELGYIRSTVLTALPDGGERDDLVSACDRATDEARAAIDALGRSPDEPLGFVLHRAARQVADRYGGRVLVDLDDSVDVDPAQRHALVRITREAVSNAIRHGHAGAVCIRLERDADRCRLVVEDDGGGFDPASVGRSTGYGLTSMRERASALPGRLEIRSATDGGTAVTVSW